ncbi:hypothetical protein [Pseudoflavonifractor phocaeensis]|uniref:hypothetical protein n=1 Tax=Pseudoflavonifractor phocaeensis TaxID=1870988 RepID=UPI001959496D|nr:hypothetical protein [Pseudoflavonifractor phocaeensis]MBM6888361.1 hypothetical protein [Pseudoflavonifractor phocaeensis]
MKQGALIFDERSDRYDIRFDLADYERARTTGPRARQLLNSGIAIMILPYS